MAERNAYSENRSFKDANAYFQFHASNPVSGYKGTAGRIDREMAAVSFASSFSLKDTSVEEKKIGKEAAALLSKAFQRELRLAVNVNDSSSRLDNKMKRTMMARESNVKDKYKDGRLDRLTFTAPDYIFKQNFGFEGKKSNGINMRLKATDVLSKTVASSGVIETIADKIAELRAEQVVTRITFI